MAVTMTKGRRLLGELAAGSLRPFCAPFVPEAGAGSLCPRRKRRRPLLVRGPHPPSRCRLVFILYPENWRPMSTWRAKLRIDFEFIAHRAPLGFAKHFAQLGQCFLGLVGSSGLLGDSGIAHRPETAPVTSCYYPVTTEMHRNQPPHRLLRPSPFPLAGLED